MPNYQLITANRAVQLGTFESVEAVKKLRLFRDNPGLLKHLEEVPKTITPVIKGRANKFPPTELTLRRREYKHLTTLLPNLLKAQAQLYSSEKSAHRLMTNDPKCGCHTLETDHWVSISNAADSIRDAISRVRLRIKQLSVLDKNITRVSRKQ